MAKIKTLSIWSTLQEGGEVFPAFERSYQEFDSENRLVLEIERTDAGEELRREEYAYDNEGRKVREYKLFVPEGMEETHLWAYDEAGRVVREQSEYAGGFATVKHYTYGEGEITIRVTDEEDTPEGREVHQLDEEGKVTERWEYDEEDTLKAHVTTEYDAKGNKTREEVRSWDDVFEDEWMYEYDDQGRLAVEKQLNEEGYIILRRMLEHNEAGNMTSYLAEDLMRQSKIQRDFQYDDQGQLEVEIRYGHDRERPEATAKYSYDEGRLATQVITTPTYEAANEYRYTFHPD